MKRILFVLAALLAAGAALAQTVIKADQGKPGNQGPWPVTISGGASFTISGAVSIDGGLVATVPAQCRAAQLDGGSTQRVTSVGTSATNVPATGASSATRYYMTVCNSSENSGTPLVKCLYNAATPVMGVANPGPVLGVSDCWLFPIAGVNQLKCISDTASTAVTSDECLP